MASPTSSNEPKIKINKEKYAGQVVVVTGAAQGIGRATAELFAAQGATMVLLDLQEEKLKEFQTSLEQQGGYAAFRVCNITDEESIAGTFKWIIAEHSKIDVLAHIAGIYPAHPLVDFPTQLYRQIMTVNLDATFFLVRAVIPYMQARGYGRVVLTSSSTFQEPEMGLSAYVASKAGVIGIMRAAAIEAGSGVTINAVMPGIIKTSTIWELGVQPDGSHPLFEHVMGKQIVKRYGQPEDVAHAISFLSSPEASFITGQILDVSGGETYH